MSQQQTENQPQFIIQRIYVKDCSFEAPNTPQVFQSEWRPELNVDVQSRNEQLDKENYDVVLAVTVTTKIDGKTAFLAECHQAGIFTVTGFDEDSLKEILGPQCATILYPYARQVLSDLVSKGGFPQLTLAPINFKAAFDESVIQQQDGEKASSEEEAGSVH